MKALKNAGLVLVLLLLASCESNLQESTITATLEQALPAIMKQESKTLLVISSVDCNRCIYGELNQFLKQNQCDGVLLVANGPKDKVELDQNVQDVLNKHAIKIYRQDSPELIIDIGKYSGIRQSPYILTYADKDLSIAGLRGS